MQNNLIDFNNLHIITYPDPILARKAEPITEITPEIVNLAERMVDIMVRASGIGLAAPQVGVLLRLFVFSISGKRDDAEVIINPQLSKLHGQSEMEEGCLSLPGVRSKVRRSASCSVKALDLDGNEFVMDAVDMAATVFQHETDHLDGTLFIDRLNTVSRLACRRALKQLERDYNGNN